MGQERKEMENVKLIGYCLAWHEIGAIVFRYLTILDMRL